MIKRYDVVNVSFILNAEEDVHEFINKEVYPFKGEVTKKIYINYKTSILDYYKLKSYYKNNEKKLVKFYSEEYKERLVDNRNIVLIDDNSIIVHKIDNNVFYIIGKNKKAMKQIVYLFREAIYEEYLLEEHLLLHAAAFSNNNNAVAVIGKSGAGKTTLTMEMLKKTDSKFITNDLLGIIDDRLMASIIPIRVANGQMNRFSKEKADSLTDKKTYSVSEFLKQFDFRSDNNVLVKKIVLPHFDIHNNFEIKELSKDYVHNVIFTQTFNIQDQIRPYLWVNEFEREDVCSFKDISDKINDLLKKTDCYSLSYGINIDNEEIDEIKKVLSLK